MLSEEIWLPFVYATLKSSSCCGVRPGMVTASGKGRSGPVEMKKPSTAGSLLRRTKYAVPFGCGFTIGTFTPPTLIENELRSMAYPRVGKLGLLTKLFESTLKLIV